MKTKKNFHVDCADVKDVLVTSFCYYDPFEGALEGTEHSLAMGKLENLIEETKMEGHYFKLTPDQIVKVRHPNKWDIDRARPTDLLKPDEALHCYLFKVQLYYVSKNYDVYHLSVYWFGEAPSGDETLRDIVSSRMQTINLIENALTYNLDDDL